RDGGLAGWSAALGLELRPQGHALRLFDPAHGEFLPNSGEKSRIIEAVKAERETVKAERDAVKAERDAANVERDAEAAARRAAEARIAELERRLAEAGG
ncbi:MAG: hypothetical protein OXF68_14780, partial [Gammaproteobacteria bacterium]|nr:hypothetical protein [Gammaproteobacteria bacterium]